MVLQTFSLPWNCYSECFVRPLIGDGRTNRLCIPVSFGETSTDGYVDTGAAYTMLLNRQLVEFLELEPDRSLERTRINFRGSTIIGFLDRIEIGLLDYQSEETYYFDTTAFYPDFWKKQPSFDHNVPDIIIGFHGALEHIGFGFVPRERQEDKDRFYFMVEQ